MANWHPPQSMQRDLHRLTVADSEHSFDLQVDDEVHDRNVTAGRERILELRALVDGLLEGTADPDTVQAAVASLQADAAAAMAEIADAAGRFAEVDHPRLEAAHATYHQVLQALDRLQALCQGPPTVSLTAAMEELETAVAPL